MSIVGSCSSLHVYERYVATPSLELRLRGILAREYAHYRMPMCGGANHWAPRTACSRLETVGQSYLLDAGMGTLVFEAVWWEPRMSICIHPGLWICSDRCRSSLPHGFFPWHVLVRRCLIAAVGVCVCVRCVLPDASTHTEIVCISIWQYTQFG